MGVSFEAALISRLKLLIAHKMDIVDALLKTLTVDPKAGTLALQAAEGDADFAHTLLLVASDPAYLECGVSLVARAGCVGGCALDDC